jgi:hypothetical protein
MRAWDEVIKATSEIYHACDGLRPVHTKNLLLLKPEPNLGLLLAYTTLKQPILLSAS